MYECDWQVMISPPTALATAPPLQFQPLSIHNVSFASEMAETTYIHIHTYIFDQIKTTTYL